MTESEPDPEKFNVLFEQFDQLRQVRMAAIQGIPDDPDIFLADIANMASLLYVIRRLVPDNTIVTEYQPLTEETKEDER